MPLFWKQESSDFNRFILIYSALARAPGGRCSFAAFSLLICCSENGKPEDFRRESRKFAADSLQMQQKIAAGTRVFRGFRRGEKLYRHTLYPLLVRQSYRLEKMTEALLRGSAEVHNWCRVSWREHWRPYDEAGVPMVRYEDLLNAPEKEARHILRDLEIERSADEIAAAGADDSPTRPGAGDRDAGQRR